MIYHVYIILQLVLILLGYAPIPIIIVIIEECIKCIFVYRGELDYKWSLTCRKHIILISTFKQQDTGITVANMTDREWRRGVNKTNALHIWSQKYYPVRKTRFKLNPTMYALLYPSDSKQSFGLLTINMFLNILYLLYLFNNCLKVKGCI